MELNEVKEKYIAQFFELCSEYIDKMEIYQTEIYKLTINRHYEALLKRLKSAQKVSTTGAEVTIGWLK